MTINARYGGRCEACGCWFEAGTPVEWDRETRKTRHATPEACAAARAAREAQQLPLPQVASHAPIARFIAAARERGLRFPKVRFLAPDGRSELRLTLAGPGSKAPGSVNVLLAGDWVGRVEPDGRVVGRRLATDRPLLDTLARIAEDPAAAATAYGRLTSRCSFCNASLFDDRTGGSVEVGYGPKCAERYGLPHHPTGARRQLGVVPVPPASSVPAPRTPAATTAALFVPELVDEDPDPEDAHADAVEEASTLGLDGWPPQLTYDGRVLYRTRTRRDREGDVTSVVYEADGAKLVVLND